MPLLVLVQGTSSAAPFVILTAVQSSGMRAGLRRGEPLATKSPHMQGRVRLGENPSRCRRQRSPFLH